MLWGLIGFFVGCGSVALSLAIGVLVLQRGALLLGYLLAIPIAIPFLGAAAFFAHGLHRGAARAALELEQKFGLVRYVVSRLTQPIVAELGDVAQKIPL